MKNCANKSALHKTNYTLGLVPISDYVFPVGYGPERLAVEGILGLVHYRTRGEELTRSISTTTTTSKRIIYAKFTKRATLRLSPVEF